MPGLMTDYFEEATKRPAIASNEPFLADTTRSDLILDQYKLSRQKLLSQDKQLEIDEMYAKWCDLLFTGYNIVIFGPQSKFALLETFKKRYLDSDRLPDWLELASQSDELQQVESAKHKKSKLKNTIQVPMLDITTVRLHGLDPIKAETFNHAIFDIKETRRLRDSDYIEFKTKVRQDNLHYVFLIHSFDYLMRDREEICDTIFQLYRMNSRFVHLVFSIDSWNAGKKAMNLKYSLNLIYFYSPMPECLFLWEKTRLLEDFDRLGGNLGNDTAIHRLYNEETDLQSLKDIHQAIGSATQQILIYILRDYIEKCEANAAVEATIERKRFQARDAEDDEVRELGPQDTTSTNVDGGRRLTRNRRRTGRVSKVAGGASGNETTPRKRKASELTVTYLEFHHLLKYCESNFIIRRGTALRDHLGELRDHNIVSESDDDGGNKIQCLVEVETCKRFIEWLDSSQAIE